MTRPYNQWTPAQITALVALYPDTPSAAIAAQIGRDVQSVYRKAQALGLRKTHEFLSSQHSGRIQAGTTDRRMTSGRFQPGLVPWNKGRSYQAGGRSVQTQFKPGRLPHEARNYQPIGSLRINRDGYLERKMTDDRTLAPVRRWVAVHRLVWEAAHGPVPADHIVIYRPGCKTVVLEEITLDRLECITRAENARRNSAWTRLPPEVARLHQLKGAITRQVNRIAREAREGRQPEPDHQQGTA